MNSVKEQYFEKQCSKLTVMLFYVVTGASVMAAQQWVTQPNAFVAPRVGRLWRSGVRKGTAVSQDIQVSNQFV